MLTDGGAPPGRDRPERRSATSPPLGARRNAFRASLHGSVFDVTLGEREPGMAFLDKGEQFLALIEGRAQLPDRDRHVGLVVDDKEAVRAALTEVGAELLPGQRRHRDEVGWQPAEPMLDVGGIRIENTCSSPTTASRS